MSNRRKINDKATRMWTTMDKIKTIRCDRCGRRAPRRSAVTNLWNLTVVKGYIMGFLCPSCQTPEENAEAEINLATLDYGTDALGQLVGAPRSGG